MEIIHDLTVDGRIKIVQDSDLNNYTFDSLLLVDFIRVNKKIKNIIDLCAGNGPIGLLLRDKLSGTIIDCVEIQKENCDLLDKSISLNNFSDINVYNNDLKGINKIIGNNKYQLVTFNPPYFKVEDNSNLNESYNISIARHEILVTLEDIIKESKSLLSNIGYVSFVHRPDRLSDIVILLSKYNFYITRLKFVYKDINSECHTILVEASRSNKGNMVIEKPLYVYEEDGSYTKSALDIINF